SLVVLPGCGGHGGCRTDLKITPRSHSQQSLHGAAWESHRQQRRGGNRSPAARESHHQQLRSVSRSLAARESHHQQCRGRSHSLAALDPP
ncbi:hypothetical protein HispidOSU_015552, partial [Sigmodon hispidus]